MNAPGAAPNLTHMNPAPHDPSPDNAAPNNPRAHATDAHAASDSTASNRPAQVLIADDNPQIVELLEAYLEGLPVETTTAFDGDQTIAAVDAKRPDVLLLDVMMPRRSGFEVCRQLKQDPSTRDIPVIMVTALNEDGDLERARECGADHFITKPVNKIALIQLIAHVLKLPQ